MDCDAPAPARPPFGAPQARPKAASGAGHRSASAAAVKHWVNCHRNPEPFVGVRPALQQGRTPAAASGADEALRPAIRTSANLWEFFVSVDPLGNFPPKTEAFGLPYPHKNGGRTGHASYFP